MHTSYYRCSGFSRGKTGKEISGKLKKGVDISEDADII
jgi:hypothetical protein